MPVARLLVVAVLLSAGVATWLVATGSESSPAPTTPAWAGGSALGVLHSWDARRAKAYADGSASRLRDLYVPGSAAGAADLRLLRSYRDRGLRVTGMRTQVLSLSVLASHRGWRRLRVTDRLVGAVAAGLEQTAVLPRDEASSHVITLMRGADGRWRVADATDPAR